jgi:class 3 adenylate cyclase
VRISLSSKFALIAALLVVVAAGVTSVLLLIRFSSAWEDELVGRDRELAKVLAGLRTREGRLDFITLASFVESSDQVDTGLVYAFLRDPKGTLRQGTINPRLFASLDASFRALVLQGRNRVLELLAAGKVDRLGKIKESKVAVPGGTLHLGFDLWRIDRQVKEAYRAGLMILGVALLVGVLGSFFLARMLTAPVKRLAGAMDAVARGELDQTVKVSSTDELAAMARSFNQMTRTLKERDWGREHLRPYLSTGVMERILGDDNALEMGSEEAAATALSLSFRELEAIHLQLDGAAVLRLNNEYLAPVIDAITHHQGVVTRMDGRRLIAVWGLPSPVKDPELCAIRGAQAARASARREARRQVAVGGVAMEPCIGVASGRAAAGNLGSAKRVEFAVLGGAVELARHIELLARPGELLVNEAAFSKVRDQVTGSAGAPLMLEGMEEAVPTYRLDD